MIDSHPNWRLQPSRFQRFADFSRPSAIVDFARAYNPRLRTDANREVSISDQLDELDGVFVADRLKRRGRPSRMRMTLAFAPA